MLINTLHALLAISPGADTQAANPFYLATSLANFTQASSIFFSCCLFLSPCSALTQPIPFILLQQEITLTGAGIPVPFLSDGFQLEFQPFPKSRTPVLQREPSSPSRLLHQRAWKRSQRRWISGRAPRFSSVQLLLLLGNAAAAAYRSSAGGYQIVLFSFFQLIKRCGILALAQSDASSQAVLRVFLGVFKKSFLLSSGNRSPQWTLNS